MNTPNIVAISTSLADASRSRVAASVVADELKTLGAEVSTIDLHASPLAGYPHADEDPAIETYQEQVRAADGLLLAFPIHNWGESGQTRDFLAYVLDKETMQNKVALLVAGCSTKSSFLAPMSVGRTLQAEIGAVVIGPGILACGDDVDREQGTVVDGLKQRLQHGAKLLHAFSSVEI